jgi:predicted RNase H-like HicB family nuclease
MSVRKLEGVNARVNAGRIAPDGGPVLAHLAIIKDVDDSFSVLVLNLKGCGSCGDTEEEAVANTREAVAGVVASYRDDGIEIPWVDTPEDDEIPPGAKLQWIAVNV